MLAKYFDYAILSELISICKKIHKYLLQTMMISVNEFWKMLSKTQLDFVRLKFSLLVYDLYDLVNTIYSKNLRYIRTEASF
jgi:hypothetical protein